MRWLAGLIARLHGTFDRLKPVEVVETFAEIVADRDGSPSRSRGGAGTPGQFRGDGRVRGAEGSTGGGPRAACSRRVGSTACRSTIASGWRPTGTTSRRSSPSWPRCSSSRSFATASSTPTCTRGTCWSTGTAGCTRSISASWGGSTVRRGATSPTCCIRSSCATTAGSPRSMSSAGLVPADQSVDGFAQAARAIAEPILGLPLNQISLARLVGQLFQVTKRFKMEVQPQLLLLQKTMLVAEGVGRRLHPETNMWELAPTADRGVDGRADGAAGARPRDRGNAVGRAGPPAQGARRSRTGRSTCSPRTASSSTPKPVAALRSEMAGRRHTRGVSGSPWPSAGGCGGGARLDAGRGVGRRRPVPAAFRNAAPRYRPGSSRPPYPGTRSGELRSKRRIDIGRGGVTLEIGRRHAGTVRP